MHPVLHVQARPNPGLHETTIEVDAVAGGKEDDVRDAVRGMVSEVIPPRQSVREGNVDVRRPEVRTRQQVVEALANNASILQVLRL